MLHATNLTRFRFIHDDEGVNEKIYDEEEEEEEERR